MARGLRIGSKAEALNGLRALLRVARERSPDKSLRSSKFAQEILAQYRARQHETDRERMRAFRMEATDYLTLLQGVQEQRFLWDLDAGAEKKLSGQEIVNLSAKRVGLSVPDMYVDQEEQKRKAEEQRKRDAAAKYLADKRAKEAAAKA